MSELVPSKHRVAIWSSKAMMPLCQEWEQRMHHWSLCAVGTAERNSPVNAGSGILEYENLACYDDPRMMLEEQRPDILVLADSQNIAYSTLHKVLKSGTQVLSLTPPVQKLEDAIDLDRLARSPEKLLFLPCWSHDPLFEAATDREHRLGTPDHMQLTCWCPVSEGGLFTALMISLQVMLQYFDLPISADAQLTVAQGAVDLSPGKLSGTLSAHLKFQQGNSVSLTLSDHGDAARRNLTLMNHRAVLDCAEDWFVIQSIDGEQPGFEGARSDHEDYQWPLDSIIDQYQRIKEGSLQAPAISYGQIMACISAMLLSSTTGTSESPMTMLSSHGGKL